MYITQLRTLCCGHTASVTPSSGGHAVTRAAINTLNGTMGMPTERLQLDEPTPAEHANNRRMLGEKRRAA